MTDSNNIQRVQARKFFLSRISYYASRIIQVVVHYLIVVLRAIGDMFLEAIGKK